MNVFGCLFFAIIGVLLFAVIAVLTVIQKVLGWFGIHFPWYRFLKVKGYNPSEFSAGETGYAQDSTHESTANGNTTFSSSGKAGRKKVYGDDEGEYVNFEEVKD